MRTFFCTGTHEENTVYDLVVNVFEASPVKTMTETPGPRYEATSSKVSAFPKVAMSPAVPEVCRSEYQDAAHNASAVSRLAMAVDIDDHSHGIAQAWKWFYHNEYAAERCKTKKCEAEKRKTIRLTASTLAEGSLVPGQSRRKKSAPENNAGSLDWDTMHMTHEIEDA